MEMQWNHYICFGGYIWKDRSMSHHFRHMSKFLSEPESRLMSGGKLCRASFEDCSWSHHFLDQLLQCLMKDQDSVLQWQLSCLKRYGKSMGIRNFRKYTNSSINKNLKYIYILQLSIPYSPPTSTLCKSSD